MNKSKMRNNILKNGISIFSFFVIINVLMMIGLVYLTKFSFTAKKEGDNYFLHLQEWEFGFTKFTVVLCWLSMIVNLFFMWILTILSLVPLVQLLAAPMLALFISNLMGLIYLTNFSFSATHRDGIYKISLKAWEYNLSKVTVVMTWLSQIGLLSAASASILNIIF